MQASIDDQRFLARAFQLAEKGRFSCSPNPMVGAVIVRDGEIIGEGWHEYAGEGHAEVNAIASVNDGCIGATIYVTLEPCNHHGRTPPCVEAILREGMSRVVIGAADNNPEAAGGAKRLRENGVQVDFLGGWPEINTGFVKRTSHGLPFVSCKLAASIDGRTAMASGESQWITGPAARYQVQRMRAASCAIITGIDSVLIDDSQLTVRTDSWLEPYPHQRVRQPLRVVLDSNLKLPLDSKIAGENTLVFCLNADSDKKAALEQQGCEVVVLDNLSRICLKTVLVYLAEHKLCNYVMVEAGATLSGAFIEQGLVDELYLFTANSLMGSQARPLVKLPLDEMSQKIPLYLKKTLQVGDDTLQIMGISGE